MAKQTKGVIGILTGGGDVPGLNPAIRAVTIRASREGYKVIGIRRGWGGLVDIVRDKKADNSNNYRVLTEEIVNRAGRTGGTFLHSSRTNPTRVKKDALPEHLKDKYTEDVNDVTPDVLENLDFLGIDYLIQGLAPTIGWLFVGRLLAGIMGASFTTANAYIADVSEPSNRARNYGLIGVVFGLGFIVGPAMGGLLGAVHLRLPFFVAAGLALVNWL